jgi:hypothetical protein
MLPLTHTLCDAALQRLGPTYGAILNGQPCCHLSTEANTAPARRRLHGGKLYCAIFEIISKQLTAAHEMHIRRSSRLNAVFFHHSQSDLLFLKFQFKWLFTFTFYN